MVLHEEPAEYNWLRLLFLIPIGFVIGAIVLASSQVPFLHYYSISSCQENIKYIRTS